VFTMTEKRVSIRVEPELHAKARAKAALTGQSLSDVVRDFLREWTKDIGYQPKLIDDDK